MAIRDIVYKFTGDVSSLSRATQTALNLIDKYSQRVSSSFTKIGSSTKSLNNSFISLTGTTKLLSRALDTLTGVKLGDWLSQSAKKSIDFVENLNLFKVALGESIDKGLEFVDTMSELYGMDPSNLYRYTGYFYQLTDAIGMADSASSTIALSLTKASNDIASLFNVDIETVVNNLASGMQGMARAVRKYGVDIRAVTLQQTALNYGITQQVSEMSEADRQALRYLTMMEQIKNATKQTVDTTVEASGVMGDFARNIETPANQLRIFREQMSQLGRAIGNFFIPMLSKLLPIINGFIMALRTVLTFLFTLTGFKLDFGGASSGAASSAEAIAGIGEAADGTSRRLKELKKTIAPFDEINLLNAPSQPTGSSGSGGGGGIEGNLNPALAEAIENMSLGLEDIKMKANEVRDKLLEFFGFDYVEVFNPETGEWEKKLQWFADKFRQNLIDKFPQWKKTINALFDNWPAIIESIKKLFKSLGDVWQTVKDKVKSFIDSLHLDDVFANLIADLPNKLGKLSSWIDDHRDQIADFIILIGKFGAAFKVVKIIAKYLAPIVSIGAKFISIFTTVTSVVLSFVSAISSMLTVVGLIAAAIYLLYTNSSSFADSFNTFLQALVNSFTPIWEALKTFAEVFWTTLVDMWEGHLQPLIESLGDMLAPVVDNITTLWVVLVNLFVGIMATIDELWIDLVDIFNSVWDVLSSTADMIGNLWEKAVGPVIDHILESLPDLWNNTLHPILVKVGDIISGLIDIIAALWNRYLMPFINYLVNVLGPTISSVVNVVWDIVMQVIDDIGDAIEAVLDVIQGVIDFVAGVFTGDWERAWNGIKEIFTGVINGIITVFESGFNLIISGVNLVINLIWNAVQTAVNAILDGISAVADFVGIDIDLHWGTPPPALGYLSLPRVALAQGGVVTGPTAALIGEGAYDEAVIPLGNSPQMEDFANTIAGKLSNAEQVNLLREQNYLLRQILENSGDSIGIRDLASAVTRIQRQEMRAGGY